MGFRRALPLAARARGAVNLLLGAVLVEDAVAVRLFERVPPAEVAVGAGVDALPEAGDLEGVDEVALALEGALALASFCWRKDMQLEGTSVM